MTDSHQRLQAATASLDELNVDAMLVTDEVNVRYLSGFTGDSSALLITASQTIMLSDGRFATQISIDCPELTPAIRPPSQQLLVVAATLINDIKLDRVAIEANDLRLASFRGLESNCDSVELVETNGVVERQRMIKDADEIEVIRAAIRIAEEAIAVVLESIGPESTEQQLAYQIESEMRSRGAAGCSFPAIVAGGAAAALPHYHPGPSRISDHDTLLIDWGASYRGYVSDLTRTFHSGGASQRFRSAYQAVLEAQLAAIDAIAPGVEASAIDQAARSVLADAGIGDAFVHSLGHGIGMAVHEGPRVSPTGNQTLCSGMVITIEPGVYFAGDFGIRIEDDVLVTESGCEVLSRLPKGLDDCRLIR